MIFRCFKCHKDFKIPKILLKLIIKGFDGNVYCPYCDSKETVNKGVK